MSDEPDKTLHKFGHAHFDAEGVLIVVWLSDAGAKGSNVIFTLEENGEYAVSAKSDKYTFRNSGKLDGKWPDELDAVKYEDR